MRCTSGTCAAASGSLTRFRAGARAACAVAPTIEAANAVRDVVYSRLALCRSAAVSRGLRRFLAQEERADSSVERPDCRGTHGERSDQRLQKNAAGTWIEIGVSRRGKRQRGEGDEDFEHGES